MVEAVNIVLLGLLVITAVAAIRLHDLFAVVMMFGIYSLLAATVFVVLDAVDVAFTEAAVGVGISTILMLTTLGLLGASPCTSPFLAFAGGRGYRCGFDLWNVGHAALW